jgi:hypothetical protein
MTRPSALGEAQPTVPRFSARSANSIHIIGLLSTDTDGHWSSFGDQSGTRRDFPESFRSSRDAKRHDICVERLTVPIKATLPSA